LERSSWHLKNNTLSLSTFKRQLKHFYYTEHVRAYFTVMLTHYITCYIMSIFSFSSVNEYSTVATAEGRTVRVAGRRQPAGQCHCVCVILLMGTSQYPLRIVAVDNTPGDECGWVAACQTDRCPIALNAIDLNSYRLSATGKMRA